MQLSMSNVVFQNPAGSRCCIAEPGLMVNVDQRCYGQNCGAFWSTRIVVVGCLVCFVFFFAKLINSLIKSTTTTKKPKKWISFAKHVLYLLLECRPLQWCVASVWPGDHHLLQAVYVALALVLAANGITWVASVSELPCVCVCEHNRSTADLLITEFSD